METNYQTRLVRTYLMGQIRIFIIVYLVFHIHDGKIWY